MQSTVSGRVDMLSLWRKLVLVSKTVNMKRKRK